MYHYRFVIRRDVTGYSSLTTLKTKVEMVISETVRVCYNMIYLSKIVMCQIIEVARDAK